MATTGHEPRPGQTSTAAGVPTSGISPSTTTAAMTGGTPGVSTNPADSKNDKSLGSTTATPGAGTAATSPYTPDSARSGMSSGDMARAASGTTTTGRGSTTDRDSALGGSTASTGGQTEELRQEARQTGETVKEEARRAAEALKEEARQTMRQVANRQKDAAAGEMSGLSRALRRAADELEGHSHLPVEGYVRRAAQSLDDLSENLRRRDVDTVVSRLEQFSREQPAIVIGGAVAAGFLLARMLRGTAEAAAKPDYPSDRYH